MNFTIEYKKNGTPFISRQRIGKDWKNWAYECREVNKYLENNGYSLCVDTAYYDEDTNSQIFELKELEDDEEGNEKN